MIRSAKEFENYNLEARDGEMGRVKGFYFDEDEWSVRYLIVETGSWLNSRKVPISPLAVLSTDWDRKTLQVDLTQEQVKNSPPVDTAQPVYRRHETELSDYYGWPHYWGATVFAGGGVVVTRPAKVVAVPVQDRAVVHSTHEAMGYGIEATDGSIGHVEDFLVDDRSWQIRYLVVDTRNWWPGKKVLVAPQWIQDIRWGESKLFVDLSRDAIKASPEYDPSAPMDVTYANRLHDHYGKTRHPHW